MTPIYYILLTLFLVLSLFLVLLVLLQKGRGGGLASAFGGVGGNTAFGAKTGDVLTWATSVVFAVFILLAIGLNLLANSIHARNTNPFREDAPAATAVDPAAETADDLRRRTTTTSPSTGPLFPEDATTKPTTAPVAATPTTGPSTAPTTQP